MRWLDGIINGHELEQTLRAGDRETWCAAVQGSQRVGHNLATEQQQIPSWMSVHLYPNRPKKSQ